MTAFIRPRPAAEIRELDRQAIQEYGIPGLLLMENAGSGAAACIHRRHPQAGRAHIWCGKGNNGGDGFVIARHLFNRGWTVRCYCAFGLADAPRTGDAGENLGICERMGLVLVDLAEGALRSFQHAVERGDIVVDALLGTGTEGEVRSPYDEIIAAVNEAPGQVVAVDTPSGLHCDTGEVLGVAVKAGWTVTFAAPKVGFFRTAAARQHTGEVEVLQISIPRFLYPELTREEE